MKAELAKLVETLKSAHIDGLRPVGVGGIHLTLKFLGEVDVESIEPLTRELTQRVAPHQPFVVQLGGPGVFPNRSSPRVLWVGIDGDLPSLGRLQQAVEGAAVRLGHPSDRRAFSPHLTLARIRDRTPDRDLREAAEALFSAGFKTGMSIPVESVSLMRSVLGPAGADYQRLARFPLARKAI